MQESEVFFLSEAKEGRKVRYTKKVLRDSLVELLQSYPINKITVKMISEQADVNRGTFYAYYRDAYDLLEATENEMFDAILANISTYTPENYREMMTRIFDEIEKNRELYRVLFGENGDKVFVKRILYIAHDRTIEEWEKAYTGVEPHMFEMAYNYLISGSMGVLSDWIKDSMGMSTPQMVDFLVNFWYYGLETFKMS